jgi:hypothetical protein
MQERKEELHGKCLLSKLYGISAMGTCYAMYTIDTLTCVQHPPDLPSHPTQTIDTTPVDWWCNEILEPEGQEILCAIFQEVRCMMAVRRVRVIVDRDEECAWDNLDSD